jgi:ATP-binding cassette subfamily B protein
VPPAHSRKPSPAPAPDARGRLRAAVEVFAQFPGTFRLVWEADRRGTLAIAGFTTVAALLPAPLAWVGKLIIDAVLQASRSGSEAAREASSPGGSLDSCASCSGHTWATG